MAQWWEHLTPTNGAWVQIQESIPYSWVVLLVHKGFLDPQYKPMESAEKLATLSSYATTSDVYLHFLRPHYILMFSSSRSLRSSLGNTLSSNCLKF